MTIYLRQSTSAVVSFGPFVGPTDGVTLVTGLVSALDHASTGIFISKNGGTLAVRHATVTATTYDAYGNYKVTLDTTDTATLGALRMQFAAAASCLPVWQDFMVVPGQVWDSLFGADLLQVDVQQFGNANGTFTSGKPDVQNVAGNVTGSVGSVTGAVGSVTGSVGSVTGLTAANLDVAVSSRLAPTVAARTLDVSATGEAGVDWGNVGSPTTTVGLTGTTISSTQVVASVSGAVGSVTGNVGGNVVGSVGSVTAAVALTSSERNSVADAILDRNMATGTDSGSSSVRTVRQALRFLRNKWQITSGTLTVYKEDDSTSSWTSTLTGTPGADPITTSDPA